MKKKDLTGSTIVITGATSGNGKALALSFAAKGTNLVLAARRELILKEVAEECHRLGSNAIAVKTDVTRKEEVRHLFEKAQRTFGKIDIWINNAGVVSVGEFTETPMEVHEQVLRTNLIASMYCAHYVIPHFKLNDSGTLINMNSIGAFVPSPYSVAYSASKFGLKGFSESLRDELVSFPNIHVCDVFPSFVDTPGMVHAANFTGKKLKPFPPVLDPFQVADAVVSLAQRPRDNVMVGSAARAARLIHFLMPGLTGKVMTKMADAYFKQAREVPLTEGNLFRPDVRGTRVHGGWKSMNLHYRLKQIFQRGKLELPT